ncbi:MAG: hypothetical protein ACOX1U_07455 [Saccharofermentanales bacterium]|jgi:hypothetical protein
MKGFRKMDEMEMSITVRAIRIAWIYASLFLIVWIGHDWLKMRLFQWVPFCLLTSQLLIYWVVQLFLKWKLGKDEK